MFDLDKFIHLEKKSFIPEMTIRIKEVYENEPMKFLSFLYRFDLSEEYVLPLLKAKKYTQIAELIWNRQMNKVKNWNREKS